MWCQGYSEPGAGSDLANLQTRAELRGDRYVVNGQKIWTSGAHHADWIYCLVRTDPDAERHGGIGFLLIDMATPGVEVRPLVQMTRNRDFNETFFTDVEVPAENIVGKPTEGWRVSQTLLSYERGREHALALPRVRAQPPPNRRPGGQDPTGRTLGRHGSGVSPGLCAACDRGRDPAAQLLALTHAARPGREAGPGVEHHEGLSFRARPSHVAARQLAHGPLWPAVAWLRPGSRRRALGAASAPVLRWDDRRWHE